VNDGSRVMLYPLPGKELLCPGPREVENSGVREGELEEQRD